MTDLNQETDMESKEKNTKEKILEEALFSGMLGDAEKASQTALDLL